jgi:hypothetical protein
MTMGWFARDHEKALVDNIYQSSILLKAIDSRKDVSE